MIAAVEDLLAADEELDIPKLKQKEQTLEGKTELLSKLDEEIMEMIGEDELDDEVGQNDEIRERIELAVIKLDPPPQSQMNRGTPQNLVFPRPPM